MELECRAFNLPVPGELHEAAVVTAPVSPDQPLADRQGLHAAMWGYSMCARLSKDADAEFERHLSNPEYLNKLNTYASHRDELVALGTLSQADHDYLAAFTAFDRQGMLESAARSYRE